LSEIRTDTISAANGTDPVTLTKQSAAKAWVNFNGIGTVAIRESFAVSSITDVSTGIYRANFLSNMSGSYTYSALLGSGSAVYDQGTLQDVSTSSYVGIKVQDGKIDTFIDVSIVSVGILGDLA
jgi:hypothetical protein